MQEHGIIPREFNNWASGIIDVLDPPTCSRTQALKTVSAVIAPYYFSSHAAAYVNNSSKHFGFCVFFAAHSFLFVGWLVMMVASLGLDGAAIVGWLLYVTFAAHMTFVRSNIRRMRVRLPSAVFMVALLPCHRSELHCLHVYKTLLPSASSQSCAFLNALVLSPHSCVCRTSAAIFCQML